MLSRDSIDKLDFVNDEGRKYLWQIAQELAYGSVVLFAGAGLSFNANHRHGGRNLMPSWPDLVDQLRARLDDDIRADTDPLKVADYFETKFGRANLVNAVRESVKNADHVPGRVHKAIARLNFEEIITTNFDTLLERTFQDQLIEPQVIVRDEDLVGTRRFPRITKMNGCISLYPGEIIVTGNDFLSYAELRPVVQFFVTKSFVESTALFLGFGLSDPAFRAINERVLHMLGRANSRLSFSLQFGASRTEMDFWKNRQVQIIDLQSGKADPANPEEKLFRVLQAFGASQQDERVRDRSQKRSPLIAMAYSESRLLVREMLDLIGARLDESALNSIADDQDPRFPGISSFLGDCVRRFKLREKREPKREEALGELVVRLKEVCQLEDLESPGILLSSDQWLPLRSFADLFLEFSLRDPSGMDRGLVANLRVLNALLGLKLLILAPRFASDWGSDVAKTAATRFLKALALLDLSCLSTQDMRIRSRLVLLLCFFGRIEHVFDLAQTWFSGGNERELTGGSSLQETPVEYKLLPLSFHGVLSRLPGYSNRAAVSLWSVLGSRSDSGGGRIENAFRYRYLWQVAPDKDWAGMRLHSNRLANVLGQLYFLPEGGDDAGGPVISHLLTLLLELNRGWLFGGAAPDALSSAWNAAEGQHLIERTEKVPWEGLILFSLPILGPALFERRRLLYEIWQAGHLDTCFLVDYLVQRLGKQHFRGIGEHKAIEDSPIGLHEFGLARLADWLAELAAFEAENSPLRQKLVSDLLPPLKIWLCNAQYWEVRSLLLRTLKSFRRFAPENVEEVVQDWVISQLGQREQSASLELVDLNPPPGKLVVERHQIQMLLAHAHVQKAAGKSFRNDLLQWLVNWAESGDSLDRLTLSFLGDQIAELMIDVSPSSVEWLILAARVRLCARLRERVEEHLAQKGHAPSLYAFVKSKLREMPEQDRGQLQKKGTSLLASLIPFATELDAEMIEFMERSLESPEISSEGRNHAVHLLAALLAGAPEEMQDRHVTRWTEGLRRLLQEGAIGLGLRQEQIEGLDAESLRILQANLIALLEREKKVRPREIVMQLAEKIRLGAAIPLADLEEELVRGIQSPHEALALHSLEAVIGLARDLPAFLDRNRGRIRRIRDLVETTGSYRRLSRFAELLTELKILEQEARSSARPSA